MKFDIATKVLMDIAGEKIVETFLGLKVQEFEFIEELPQESVSLKRSDYIVKVIDSEGKTFIVVWEFLSFWKRKALLNLIDYTARVKLKHELPVLPVIILLSPNKSAKDCYEDENMIFKFRLVKLYEFKAHDFLKEADTYLLPFVPVMQGGEDIVFEADKRIYESVSVSEERADLLTAMAIFAGLKNKRLTRELIERRRDIMIESYAYEIIKEEGIKEGIKEGIEKGIQQGKIEKSQDAVLEVLEVRFDIVTLDLIKAVKKIQEIILLENLLKKAVTVKSMDEFKKVLRKADIKYQD